MYGFSIDRRLSQDEVDELNAAARRYLKRRGEDVDDGREPMDVAGEHAALTGDKAWRRTKQRILGRTRVDLHPNRDGTYYVGQYDR